MFKEIFEIEYFLIKQFVRIFFFSINKNACTEEISEA